MSFFDQPRIGTSLRGLKAAVQTHTAEELSDIIELRVDLCDDPESHVEHYNDRFVDAGNNFPPLMLTPKAGKHYNSDGDFSEGVRLLRRTSNLMEYDCVEAADIDWEVLSQTETGERYEEIAAGTDTELVISSHLNGVPPVEDLLQIIVGLASDAKEPVGLVKVVGTAWQKDQISRMIYATNLADSQSTNIATMCVGEQSLSWHRAVLLQFGSKLAFGTVDSDANEPTEKGQPEVQDLRELHDQLS